MIPESSGQVEPSLKEILLKLQQEDEWCKSDKWKDQHIHDHGRKLFPWYKDKNDLLCMIAGAYVPPDPSTRLHIIRMAHERSRHTVTDMMRKLRRNFFWDTLEEDVTEFIRKGDQFSGNQTEKDKSTSTMLYHYRCSFCPGKFEQQTSLFRHIAYAHPEHDNGQRLLEDGRYMCTLCGRFIQRVEFHRKVYSCKPKPYHGIHEILIRLLRARSRTDWNERWNESNSYLAGGDSFQKLLLGRKKRRYICPYCRTILRRESIKVHLSRFIKTPDSLHNVEEIRAMQRDGTWDLSQFVRILTHNACRQRGGPPPAGVPVEQLGILHPKYV